MASGMRRSRRDRAIDAAQELALRLCVGAGLLLGLLAGLQGHPRAAQCADGDPCVGEQFSAGLWSVFGPALAGAVTGLALGGIVVLLL